ncbi:MAG: outer membrane lipoprotein carrier protein LolA [bacterium]
MTTRTLLQPLLALLLTLPIPSPLPAGSKNPKEIIKKVQKKYRQVKTLQADFRQDFRWELTGETHSVTGIIYLQEGNKYHIETDVQKIITDGTTVWTYSKKTRQVIIDLLEKSEENPLPRDLVLKYSEEYAPVYVGEEKLDGRKMHVLNLVPKEEDTLIKSVKIWVDADNWVTRKIEQLDINDNLNTYLVSNIRDNVPLDPSLFQFQIEQDFEVVDLRETD